MNKGQTQKEVTFSSDLREELGYDSLNTIMLISELEAVFNIEIDESDFSDIVKVADIFEKLKFVTKC